MNSDGKLGRRNSENRIFADPVLNRLEDLFVLSSPLKRSRISNDIVDRFVVHVEMFDVATIKSKRSQFFQNVAFVLRSFKIL